jgi:tellurite resistance protein
MISIFGTNKGEQNESHLKNLILMARSDNDIDKSEVEVIFKIGLERGIPESRVKELLSSKERNELVVPEHDSERFEQLYDLTMVMLADGIIEDDEMEFCTDFAGKLGFRKTISWLLILMILEGIEKGVDKDWIFDRCRMYFKEK